MNDAAKSSRPAKREILSDEEGVARVGEPVVKSVKREEEPDLSPEVVELQQKVAKLEDDYQRASRAARIAELRAESAEKQLDSMNGIKDDFDAEKKRADDLDARLEISSRFEGAKANVALELVRENGVLKTEMDEMRKEQQARSIAVESRVEDLTRELQAERCKLSEKECENLALKSTLISRNERVSNLTEQLAAERQRADDEQARDRARIDDLTVKVAQYEAVLQPLLHPQQQEMQRLQLQLQQLKEQPSTSHQKTDRHLADDTLATRIFVLINDSNKCGQLKKGRGDVEKTIECGTAELIVLAADVRDAKIIRDLPTLCEDKKVPYVFVKTAAALSKASGTAHRVVVVITRKQGSQLQTQIEEIKEEVLKLH